MAKLSKKIKLWIKNKDLTSVSPIEQFLNQIKKSIEELPTSDYWEIDFKTLSAVDEYYLQVALERAKTAGLEFKILLTTSLIVRVAFSIKES